MSTPKNFVFDKKTSFSPLWVSESAIEESGYNIMQMLCYFRETAQFMAYMGITVDEMMEGMREKHIQVFDIFDFMYMPSRISDEEGISLICTKEIGHVVRWDNKRWENVVSMYDLYFTITPYVSLALSKIGEWAFFKKFPELKGSSFNTKERRFTDSIELLPSPFALVSDISLSILSENAITIAELIDIYNGHCPLDMMVDRSLFSFYWDSSVGLSIYLKVGEMDSYSINFKYTDFIDKDWESVRERHVFSIPLKEGGFFNGEQKDAPFWDAPLTKEMESFFNNL